MKLPFLSLLFLLPIAEASADEKVYLDTRFDTGIPSDFILSCEDDMKVDRLSYSFSSIGSDWLPAAVQGTVGMAAMSASRRSDPERATDNRLITPRLHIDDARAYLRWNARSVHHDLLDGYTVMISSTGNVSDLKPVLTVEEENYQWTTRLIPLADYAGKDIRIAIVHNSTHRFMLAVDNLFVGYTDSPLLKGRSASRHFAGNEGSVKVTGCVTNYNGPLKLKSLTLTTDQGTTYTMPYEATLATGGTVDYAFDLPVNVGERIDYTVSAVTAGGMVEDVLSDFLVCSHYPRILLIEKFTGMWCGSCPSATPFLYRMEDTFADEAVVVEVHGYNELSDPMSNDAYIGRMGINTYPTVMFNRRETTQGDWGNEETLRTALSAPTTGCIVSEYKVDTDGRLSVTSKVRFAQATDNADGRYRVGYILREPLVKGTAISSYYKQKNTYQGLDAAEFRFLPSSIPGELINFHNVVRGGEQSESFAALGSESGVRGSLPAETLKAETDYEVNALLDMPATVIDKDRLEVVAVLFKMANVVNVARASNKTPVGINEVASADPGFSLTASRGALRLQFAAPVRAAISLYRPDGRCVAVRTVEAGGACRLEGLAPGCYVVKVNAAGKIVTRKIILT